MAFSGKDSGTSSCVSSVQLSSTVSSDTRLFNIDREALVGRYERPHVLRHAHGHELPLTLGAEAPELLRAVAEFVLSPSLVPAGSGPGLSMGSVLALLVPAGLVALYCRSWL